MSSHAPSHSSKTLSLFPLEVSSSRRMHAAPMERLLAPVFVAGRENGELINYLRSLNRELAIEASPIVLYGPSQCGKTALASTLMARLTSGSDRKGSPLWLTGADISKQLALALQTDDLWGFRARYRSSRLMVIDQLDGILRSESAQRELVHILDERQNSQAITIATSTCVPGALRGMNRGLASRLMGGVVFEVMLPGLEARAELLRMFCEEMAFEIPAKQKEAFLSSFPSATSAVRLRSGLVHWMRQRRERTAGKSKTPRFKELVPEDHEKQAPNLNEIAKAVAKELSVTLADIKGKQRTANVVRARGLAIYLARKLSRLSLQEIGDFFGGRDHSTVLHAYRKTTNSMVSDSELARAAHELQMRWRT